MTQQPMLTISDTEQRMERSYDDDRRLRLLERIGVILSFTVLFIMLDEFVFDLQIFPTLPWFIRLVRLIPVILLYSVYMLTVVSARRKQVRLATLFFTLAVSLLSSLEIFRLTATQGLVPSYLVVLEGIIAIISLSGAAWALVSTAVFATIDTVFGFFLAPHAAGYSAFYSTAPETCAVALIFYWATTSLLLFQWRSYQLTMRDLHETRVQYFRSKQVEELKDQFITSINHELRNPVMTVIGYLDIIKHADEALPAPLQPLVDEAFAAGEKLQALVESILETRQLEQWAESLAPESVNVYESIVASASTLSRPGDALAARDLRVNVPHELQVWSETVRLRQVLTNLLANAMKYSPPGTAIDVWAVRCDDTDQRHLPAGPPLARPRVEIAVRDFGHGIPPEQMPILFQRFVRLPRDITSHVPGNGLGLYLCRTLVTAMGGTIWAESTGVEGEGTTFYVRLPIPPEG
ncbi:MAG: HAMP domain-containing histidine kinase [Ktedonobacterales bacterium]|nr:HAMP domain-containing histidine kinase [Ktedonobacterales bacterium]